MKNILFALLSILILSVSPVFARMFAQINSDNTVQRVIVCDSLAWCVTNLGGQWVETFKGVKGKNLASAGYIYYPQLNNFSSKQPFPSWTLDNNCIWQPPTPRPSWIDNYMWDESTKSWEKQ